MKKIKLTDDEFNCLYSFLPTKWKSSLNSCRKIGSNCVLDFLDEEADEIRDLCGEQLQIIGFDKEDEPTKEGMILESLIDKLFIG